MEKKVSSVITKAVQTDVAGVLELVVNSGSADRVDEILDLEGLDVSKYLQNPVVGWGHDYSQPAIGKTVALWRDEVTGYLKAKVQFANHPFAQMVYELYRDGFMTAWSIGFIPKEAEDNGDGTLTFTKSEMLEYSAVFVGADPRALTQAKALGGTKLVKALQGEMSIKDFEGTVKTVDATEDKGLVADELAEDQMQADKYGYMREFNKIVWAFTDAYFCEDVAPNQFGTLLGETLELLKPMTTAPAPVSPEAPDMGDMGYSVNKSGRVLSKSNRGKVEDAISALTTVLEADNTEGKSADYTALDVPIATAEKAIAGMRRLVYSGDQMAIKKQAQILDKSAEEIIRQTKIEATKGKAVSNKIIYRKG